MTTEYGTAVRVALEAELERLHTQTDESEKVNAVDLVEDHIVAATYLIACCIRSGQDRDQLQSMVFQMLEVTLDAHLEMGVLQDNTPVTVQ